MRLYQKEIESALDAKSHEQREQCTKMIIAEERLIQEYRFLQPLGPNQMAEMEDQLLQLRQLQYYVRYGDYLKIVPTRLRIHAGKDKTQNSKALSGANYWSVIAGNLENEEAARLKKLLKGSVLDPINLDTVN